MVSYPEIVAHNSLTLVIRILASPKLPSASRPASISTLPVVAIR